MMQSDADAIDMLGRLPTVADLTECYIHFTFHCDGIAHGGGNGQL